jgi:hypothetical protein
LPDILGFSHKTVWQAFLLAGMGEIATMTAEKIFFGCIKNRYPLPATYCFYSDIHSSLT